MGKVDYECLFKSMLDEIIEKCSGVGYEYSTDSLLGKIIENSEFPFECCEKIVKKVDCVRYNETMKAIASRKECPESMLISFMEKIIGCDDTSKDNRLDSLFKIIRLKNNDALTRKAFDMMFKDKTGIEVLLRKNLGFSEYMFGKMLKSIVRKDKDGGIVCNYYLLTQLIGNQAEIPSRYWSLVEEAYDYFRKTKNVGRKICSRYHSSWNGNRQRKIDEIQVQYLGTMLDFMRVPFDESDFDSKKIDLLTDSKNATLRYKFCYNPSISDYAITQFLFRIDGDGHLMEYYDRILEFKKDKREEYRKNHTVKEEEAS